MNALLKILLVEDNSGDADLIKMMLENTGADSFVIESVSRLSEALSRLRDSVYDLVLLDLGLPDSSGLDTLINLQAATPDMPIIILTGNTDQTVAITAVRKGAQDYLIKGQITGGIIARAIRYAFERKRTEAALRQSEEKYRSLVDNVEIGVSLISPDMKILALNRKMRSLFPNVDVAMEPVCYRAFNSPPRENICSYCPTCMTLQDGMVHESITDTPAGDGIRNYRVVSSPVRDEAGKVIAALEMVEDITERRRSEDTLQRSEERYRSLFENMLEGYAYCKMLFTNNRPEDFIYIDVNSAFETLTGLKNVVGKKVSEVIPGIQDSDPALFELYGRVALTGKPERFETYVKAMQKWFSISVYRPEKECFVAVFDVISERKQAERTLVEKEARLRLLVETIPDMIWLKDVDGRYLSCNKMFEELIGARESEIIGKTDYAFVVKELADFIRDDDNRAMAAGKSSSRMEWITFASDGRRIFLNTIKTPMYDAEGTLLGVLGISRDITEHHKLEEQLRHAQKMEGIGTLAGGIAHDFNNILSAIIGYGHITLMKLPENDPLRLNIERILESADRAATLTQGLLTFSRKRVVERKPVELNSILKKVEQLLVRIIGEDIKVRVAFAEGPMNIFGNSDNLEQVLMNLATNARDAMPNGGLFTIEAGITELDNSFVSAHGYGKPGMYAVIVATDTGVGMNEETREKIFEPFFSTKEVGKGTGLGLAMVYGIIKQHEGFINVYSEPGKGTAFRIYLPLIKTEAAVEHLVTAAEYPKGGTETILVAEDDVSVRNLTLLVLEQMGYTVITANDGEDAVKKFMQNKDRIQLLLFDIIMPNKNGREAYEEIKKIKPDILALFASGYSPDMLRVKELVDEDAVLVYKPLSPQNLLKKVREVLDRK
jgi:PAS domain S-box-containing protein